MLVVRLDGALPVLVAIGQSPQEFPAVKIEHLSEIYPLVEVISGAFFKVGTNWFIHSEILRQNRLCWMFFRFDFIELRCRIEQKFAFFCCQNRQVCIVPLRKRIAVTRSAQNKSAFATGFNERNKFIITDALRQFGVAADGYVTLFL